MKWLVRVLIGLIGLVGAMSPVFRFFMIFMDPASTMTQYLTFLGRKLGETVTPQAVN